MKAREARIVGAGLIGTSIALRLRELGWQVEIKDSNLKNQQIAADLLGSSMEISEPDFVIVATPPSSVSKALFEEFSSNPQSVFIDVSSTKTNLQAEVEGVSGLSTRFLGTHPIAGREVAGPQSARSDLFDGRAWILSPGPKVEEAFIAKVENLIAEIGATPYRMTPEEHDQLFARISHLPQILSTTLANSLEGVGEGLDIAGQGLRDMLRLARSDGSLWSEILLSNRDEVLKGITEFKDRLTEIENALRERQIAKLISLFKEANAVNSKLSGKHGLRPREYTFLNIVIEDKPGQLGALFNECAEVDANVEDLSLEHSPKQETGLIRLALSAEDSKRLQQHLIRKGWRVHL